MCCNPRLVQNPKYKPNKKNGGIIPHLSDRRVMAVPIGCGHCMLCRKKKANEWQVRLMEEIKDNKNGHFITLTFSNEQIKYLAEGKDTTGKKIAKEIESKGYERDNEIATIAVRRFLERWRKKFKKSVRHWLVTELGHEGTENIHLHGFLFTDEKAETIKNIWQYGYVWDSTTEKEGYVNEETINYCVKYVYKMDIDHPNYKAKILPSQGIGAGYTRRPNLNKYKEGETKEYYVTRTGIKKNLPNYYRNKLFTEEEREKLWIEKLDSEIRFVDGKEYDVSTEKGKEAVRKALKEAQRKSRKLGYMEPKEKWKLEEYENQRRDLLFEKRTGIKNYKPQEVKPEEIKPQEVKPQEIYDDMWDDNDYCPF